MLCSDHAWKIPKITEIYFSLINYCGHLRAEKVCSCFWLRVKWGQKAVGLDHDLSGPVAVVNLQSWADLVKTDQAVPAKRNSRSVVHSMSCWKQKTSQHYIRYCTKKGNWCCYLFPDFQPCYKEGPPAVPLKGSLWVLVPFRLASPLKQQARYPKFRGKQDVEHRPGKIQVKEK